MKNAGRGWLRRSLLALALAGLAAAVIWFGAIRPERLRSKAAAAEARAKKKAAKAARRPAQSVVARSGLPRLRAKLAARAPVTIAFLGGSITQNAGHGGFVKMIPDWLQSHAPGLAVKVINAGLAATGSDFGAKRIDRDVLVHRPDLVVVEFAVNDAARACTADMERLVRKIRQADSATDILFLYTIMDWSLPLLERGKFPESVQQHERVAAHYGVPTVALGYDAARRIRSGEWKWSTFSPDACHPTADGYASYNRDLEAALPALLATASPSLPAVPASLTPGLVEYPPPLHAAAPAPATMSDAEGNVAVETWELPVIGAEWIGAPEFPSAAEPLWRLFSRPLAADFTRAAWRPARWFDEDRSFTGLTSHPIARRDDSGGHRFGANPSEAAVLTWRAPQTGFFRVRVATAGTEGVAGTASAKAELKILRLTASDPAGVQLGALPLTAGSAAASMWEGAAPLAAGDELAFVFAAEGMKYLFALNFRVTIGRFAAPAVP